MNTSKFFKTIRKPSNIIIISGWLCLAAVVGYDAYTTYKDAQLVNHQAAELDAYKAKYGLLYDQYNTLKASYDEVSLLDQPKCETVYVPSAQPKQTREVIKHVPIYSDLFFAGDDNLLARARILRDYQINAEPTVPASN